MPVSKFVPVSLHLLSSPLEPACPSFPGSSCKPESPCQAKVWQNRLFSASSPKPSRRLLFASSFMHNWDNLSRWQQKWYCGFFKYQNYLASVGIWREKVNICCYIKNYFSLRNVSLCVQLILQLYLYNWSYLFKINTHIQWQQKLFAFSFVTFL